MAVYRWHGYRYGWNVQSIPRKLPHLPSVIQALMWRDAWLLGPPPAKGGRGVTLAHVRRLIAALPPIDLAIYVRREEAAMQPTADLVVEVLP